jgi:hypothetical protein
MPPVNFLWRTAPCTAQLKSGGHPMVGRTTTIGALVRDFLAAHRAKESMRSLPEKMRLQELESAGVTLAALRPMPRFGNRSDD